MGEIGQLALSNFFLFAVAVILIMYIIYLFIKRTVEKNDGDVSSEVEMKNRWSSLRKVIFPFLYSLMTASFIYLMEGNKTSAIIYFVVFFIAGLLIPERKRELKPKKSRTRKLLRYIFYLVLLFLFVFFTVTSPASIICKVGACLVLFIIYLLERIEKKYIISDNTCNHN